VHAGEEGHARPGWTTSRREQALAHTVPDDLRHITTHLYCWIQSTKKARDEAKDEEVDDSSKNGANRCPNDGSIVQLASKARRTVWLESSLSLCRQHHTDENVDREIELKLVEKS